MKVGTITAPNGEFDVYRTAGNATCDYFAVDGPDGWRSFATGLYWEFAYELVDFVAKRIGAVAEDCMFTTDCGTRDYYEMLEEGE